MESYTNLEGSGKRDFVKTLENKSVVMFLIYPDFF